MCGISALYKYTSLTETNLESLALMNREMHYRGPDEEGIWHDETCGLAHQRLSIIGLDNGHQPLFNEDKSLVLICNGEIYNYVELRENLIAAGHVFNSDSDSETILHLYEDHGVECLKHLRGMFAFCIWDVNARRLFVARDRIGEKTLYYAQIPSGVVFSTEAKAILKHVLPKAQLNTEALAESIRYNYPIDLKNTYIEQIKRLQGGEYALVDAEGLIVERYWERDHTPTFKGTAREAQAEVLRLMRESVNICLRSDVPVAVLLSGGVDSSAVAALARETGREVHVITAGYKGVHDSDERGTARRFAQEKDLIYHEIELDSDDFKAAFFEYTHYIDEPVCDVASMSQWALYKKARALGFTVLLNGLGGDELFYGYPTSNRIGQSLELTRSHRQLFPWKGTERKKAFLKFAAQNWKHILYAGHPIRLDDRIPVKWTYEDYSKFSQDAELSFRGKKRKLARENVDFAFGPNDGIQEVYDHVLSTFMTTQCLYLADRLGMGNSVEIRSPLIDYKLVEFVASLPLEMKCRPSEPKFFLKETLRGIVPDYILYASKRGFTPPFDFIREMARDYTYQHFSASHTFFNSMLADRLLELHMPLRFWEAAENKPDTAERTQKQF